MFEINKKFLTLLEKYKRSDDEQSFKNEYNDLFTLNVKFTNPNDMESCLIENLAAEIDRNIILDLIWMDKKTILKNGLIGEKLKRILGNEENNI